MKLKEVLRKRLKLTENKKYKKKTMIKMKKRGKLGGSFKKIKKSF
jgi:hypothetical protein